MINAKYLLMGVAGWSQQWAKEKNTEQDSSLKMCVCVFTYMCSFSAQGVFPFGPMQWYKEREP